MRQFAVEPYRQSFVVFGGAIENPDAIHNTIKIYAANNFGELVDEKNITFRNSIIGPDLERDGIGLLNWFLQQTGTVNGYTKSVWSGVTTLFLAQMIERAAIENLHGLYQLTNNMPITKHDLLKLFAKVFRKEIKISPVDGIEADKRLINTKNFGVAPSYEKMLVDLREWMLKHKNFYWHYGMENLD